MISPVCASSLFPMHMCLCPCFASWEIQKLRRPVRGADTETSPLLSVGQSQAAVSQRAHFIKAVLYALQNFYAFMLM